MIAMNRQTIRMSTFLADLGQITGSKFAGMTTVTDTKMNKTNGLKGDEKAINPFHEKVSSVRNISVNLCYDYDSGVERARTKQGEENPEDWRKGESWHNAILDSKGRLTAFCEHKTNGERYIRVRTLRKGPTTYIAKEQIETETRTYSVGDEIPYSELEPFWPKTKPYQNQGLEKGKEVAATTLKLTSVRGMRINGVEYVIEHPNSNDDVAAVSAVIERFLSTMPNVSAADIPSTELAEDSE